MSVPVAIEFVQPPDSMHVGDTVALHIRVLNRSGDSIVGAPLIIFSNDADTMAVDSVQLLVIAKVKGTGRIVARSGTFPSNPLLIPIK